jgi:hypothetical protein
MTTTVAQMTKRELREMMETLIEQKLLELLGDPDEGLEIRKSVRDRLLRQKKVVAAGERGELFDNAVCRLQLEQSSRPTMTQARTRRGEQYPRGA